MLPRALHRRRLRAKPQQVIEPRSAHEAWHLRDGHLIGDIDLLGGFASSGELIAFRDAAEVWIDIGMNGASTSPPGEDFSRVGRDVAYIGFEPLLDKYAVSVGAFVHRNNPVAVGTVLPSAAAARTARSVILPMAVADLNNEPTELNVAQMDGCSSLNALKPASALHGWDQNGVANQVRNRCTKVVETRRVPTVTLHTVLTTWLAGREVHFMHIDVQGRELNVLRSARGSIRQLRRFTLEVPSPKCAVLTVGGPTCGQVFREVSALGFEAEDVVRYRFNVTEALGRRLPRGFGCEAIPFGPKYAGPFDSLCEVDVLFVRKDVR